MSLSQTKRSYVHEAFDQGLICVFPTEVAARSYLVDYALHGRHHAILAERAISYDTFRGYFLPHHETMAPANSLTRQLFIHQLLESGSLLRCFLNPTYPEMNNRVKGYLAKLLPSLLEACHGEVLSNLDSAMQTDLLVLYGQYQQFLDEHQLFEPRYEKPSIPADWDTGKSYCILFSDTNPDAESLYEQLGRPSFMELRKAPEEDSSVSLEVFPNHLVEIKQTLKRVRDLLDAGVETHQIVIGSTATDTLMDVLREEAMLYGIPLTVREGKSVLAYSSGRFLSLIQEVYDEQFSLESLKSLLLDPGIPWAEGEKHRIFIKRAVRQSVMHGSLYGEDQYSSLLGDRDLQRWYEGLKQSIIAIVQAEDIEDLRRKINHFQDTYFIPTQWVDTPGEDVYAFCLDAMAQVGDAMEKTGITSYPRIFSFLLAHLQNKRYVFQQKSEGIAVYGWPQVSVLSADYLFILALDQEGSRCVERPLDFLPQQIEKALRREVDTTEAHFRCATLADGKRFLSCHMRRYEGEMMVPSYFLQHGRLTSYEADQQAITDPLAAELFLYKHAVLPDVKASASQKEWFLAAKKTVLAERADDYTRHPIKLDLVERLKDEKGRFQFSPTGIDQFDHCPYAWLARYLYGLKTEEYEVQPVDHQRIGMLLHSVYQQFFSEIRDYDPQEREMYQERLYALFDECLGSYYGQRGPSPSMRSWIIASYKEKMASILDGESALFAHGRSIAFEESYEVEQFPLLINGRIDRVISLNPPEDTRLAVIDYKKGVPEVKRVSGHLESFQLPIYRFLLAHGRDVSVANASYYSVKDEKYYTLWAREDDPSAILCEEQLQQRLESLLDAVQGGHLMATPSKKHCGSCPYRSLCRRRYATL
ncbi:PD-(D/E)XK nuclease family protein [uncultured Sphaerochaeta sp.]|uniref:PD-(D/E)XK nuclease family protein n=1 Tax=uncultured Sphaerochaeta sp. TaxID=886478 RepID=UPI002AA7070A|nr:PD-(D/E)XK nuclease family protein [uncultured Sphaerochaeta sp.]